MAWTMGVEGSGQASIKFPFDNLTMRFCEAESRIKACARLAHLTHRFFPPITKKGKFIV
jgi:hypothetical protein